MALLVDFVKKSCATGLTQRERRALLKHLVDAGIVKRARALVLYEVGSFLQLEAGLNVCLFLILSRKLVTARTHYLFLISG